MIPMFTIGKTIKKSGEVSFIICAIINSNEYKAASSDKEIKIKLADNSLMEFDCVKKLQKTPSGIYQTLFLARITIEEINRLRKQNKNRRYFALCGKRKFFLFVRNCLSFLEH